jgi:hypothetical protein
MEPSPQDKPPEDASPRKPALTGWGRVAMVLFVALMGVRLVAMVMKSTLPSNSPAEVLARLPPVPMPPPQPIALEFKPPPSACWTTPSAATSPCPSC